MRMTRVLRTVGTAVVATSLAAAPGWAQTTGAQQNQNQQQNQQTQQKPQDAQQRPAPVVVTLDQLEESPERYLNQRVTVRAEVEDVLGPRLFKIDERNWADLDPEVLVAMNAPLAAMVKEDDRVTVTGTMRPFTSVSLDREWGWFDVDPELEARIRTRNVLVADTVTGWDDDRLLTIVTTSPQQTAGTGGAGTGTGTGTTGTGTGTAGTATGTGTTGTAGTGTEPRTGATERRTGASTERPVTDVATLAGATDESLVGRRVSISARVDRTGDHGGFWVRSGSESLYVLPADSGVAVQSGQTVNIEGHVLRLPEQMEQRLEKADKVKNEEVYVYATHVKGGVR